MSEARISNTFTVSDNGDQIKAVSAVSYTIGTGSYFGNVQYVTSSYAAINLFGLPSAKVISLTNTSTASISIATHPASQSLSVIPAGFPLYLYPSGSLNTTYYAKATENSASLKVIVAGP
jgi:hypothetical protein